MPKNQLFKSIPPRTVCIEVLNAFGLSGFDDTHNFSRSDLEAVDCVNKMSILKNILTEYYLPCKARTYLNDLNTKNVITILRQLVRLYGFSISSREKYIKGDKFIIYQLIPAESRKYQPVSISNIYDQGIDCLVNFD